MLKKPKHLFHITKPQNVESILKEGLTPSWLDGLIYFSPKLEDVIAFSDTLRVSDVRDENNPNRIKQLKVANKLYIIKLSTSSLERSKLEKGTEHNPQFFKNSTVLTYSDKIPPSSIVQIYELNCVTGSLGFFGKRVPKIDENVIDL